MADLRGRDRRPGDLVELLHRTVGERPEHRDRHQQRDQQSVIVTSVPIAIGIAILRYRLYDIDVVLNKTVVYGALAAFITGVYVAIVVGIGALVGRGGQPNVALSILATAVVAVAFHPVRAASSGSRTISSTGRARPRTRCSPSSPTAGRHLRDRGTAAAHGTDPGRGDRRRAHRRVAAPGRHSARTPRGRPTRPRFHRPAAPLPRGLHPGASSGRAARRAVAREDAPARSLTATEQKLVEDLAGQAGLVLRNVRLTEELLARLEELRASRQRLVAAQDEERRKLERNLHDGAQQQLVALSVKARLAQQLASATRPRSSTCWSRSLRYRRRPGEPPRSRPRDLPAAAGRPGVDRRAGGAGPQGRHADHGRRTTASAGSVRTSRRPSTSAASRHCRTSRSTRTRLAVTVALSNGGGQLTFSVTDDGSGSTPRTRPTGPGCRASPIVSPRSTDR